MNKLEFIDILKQKLSLLPQNELDERINFYSEIIDDYIEDGISEEDAVSKLGSIDDVVSEVLKDTSILKLAKNKFKPKTKLEPWVILLIILSFPIWFTLLTLVNAFDNANIFFSFTFNKTLLLIGLIIS